MTPLVRAPALKQNQDCISVQSLRADPEAAGSKLLDCLEGLSSALQSLARQESRLPLSEAIPGVLGSDAAEPPGSAEEKRRSYALRQELLARQEVENLNPFALVP